MLSTSELDPLPGSSGSLIPGTTAKIIDTDANEVHSHKTRGELLLQSPSVTLGYLDDERATSETFVWHADGRWLKTGDEVLVQRSPEGSEHFLIVDRIKEMIKVKVWPHSTTPACYLIRGLTSETIAGPPSSTG